MKTKVSGEFSLSQFCCSSISSVSEVKSYQRQGVNNPAWIILLNPPPLVSSGWIFDLSEVMNDMQQQENSGIVAILQQSSILLLFMESQLPSLTPPPDSFVPVCLSLTISPISSLYFLSELLLLILRSPSHLLPWPTGQWAQTLSRTHTRTRSHNKSILQLPCLTHANRHARARTDQLPQVNPPNAELRNFSSFIFETKLRLIDMGRGRTPSPSLLTDNRPSSSV